MSGNYSRNKKKRKASRGKIIALIAALVLLCVAVVCLLVLESGRRGENSENTGTSETSAVQAETYGEPQIDAVQETTFNLGRGLQITKVGSYTGAYMEDGSDEAVSDVLMIMVTNQGQEYIEYAEIALTGDSGTANFSLSTLFPGETVVLLEKNRAAYSGEAVYETAEASRVAAFQEVPSLNADKIEIQGLNGVLNVTNISGEDITSDVVIYYKSAADDMLYGGITYCIRITGGIKAGEIRQLASEHFTASSRVMFVDCG